MEFRPFFSVVLGLIVTLFNHIISFHAQKIKKNIIENQRIICKRLFGDEGAKKAAAVGLPPK